MADTSDRSQSTQIGPGAGAGLTPAGAETFQPYRPLSLLALAGFSLSVISAVVISAGGWAPLFTHYPIFTLCAVVLTPALAALACLLVGILDPFRILKAAGFALAGALTVLGLGGLLAYSGSEPWLLREWLLVLPLAGLLLSWVARGQILRSEDTLSGLSLCNWGLGIVVVFGLMYGAYYAATYVAVRKQAAAFADDWVHRLEQGDVAGAFALTLPACATNSNCFSTSPVVRTASAFSPISARRITCGSRKARPAT
jgi:hypothetical protein